MIQRAVKRLAKWRAKRKAHDLEQRAILRALGQLARVHEVGVGATLRQISRKSGIALPRVMETIRWRAAGCGVVRRAWKGPNQAAMYALDVCRHCGCTELRGCKVDANGESCRWFGESCCSRCAP